LKDAALTAAGEEGSGREKEIAISKTIRCITPLLVAFPMPHKV
jgi:hypothetical protein